VSDVRFFDTIPVHVPREKIYARLGYRSDRTLVDARRRQLIDGWIDDAQGYVALKGAALRITVVAAGGDFVSLGAAGDLHGRHVSAWLRGCDEVLCMAATAGSRIMAAIHADVAADELTRGVVFDAAASEITDESLNWIMEYYRGELRRQNRMFTPHRYSAGYGDFGLEHQKLFYSLMRLDKLGITLTDSCMLIPEKSVTAIVGIKAIDE